VRRPGLRLCCLIGFALALAFAGPLAGGRALAETPLGLWPLRVRGLETEGAIRAFVQTPDGIGWAAGDGGLRRFDGRRFAPVRAGEGPGTVSAVAVDAGGRLWFSRAGQPLRRLEPTGETTAFGEGLPAGALLDLRLAADGTLWAIGAHEVSRLAPGQSRFQPVAVPEGNTIHRALVGRQGDVWLDTARGLARVTSPAALEAGTDPGARLSLLAEITLDDEGRRQLARAGVDASSLRAEPVAMLQDRQGRVWIGTTDGLRVVGPEGLVVVRSREGLPDDHVVRLFEDREGGVWAITHGGGLALLSILPVARLGAREGLRGNTPFGLAETADGALWVTTTAGLSVVREGKPTFVGHGGFGPLRAVAAAADGSLWMGTLGPRLVRYEPAAGRFTAHELAALRPPVLPRTIVPDGGAGVLVASTDGSLLRVGPQGAVRTLRAPVEACAGLGIGGRRCPAQLTALEPRRAGGHWAASVGDGLFVLTEADTLEPVPTTGPPETLWSMHEDADGALWLAGERGLWTLRDGRLAPVTAVRREPLFHVASDGRGDVWVGGLVGLRRVPRAAALAGPAGAPEAIVFTARDGLPSDQLMPGFSRGALRDRLGRVWFTTITGLAVATPEAYRAPPTPTPYFDEVQANGLSLTYPFVGAPEAPPGRGEIAITYGAAAFAAPHRVRFAHRLDGYDDAWVQAGDRTAAHYTNLRPGTYVFRLRASWADRPEEAREASLRLVLRPRFHQRPVFLALLAAAAGAVLAAGVALRLRALRARFAAVLAERHRIARDLHDTLAQVFAGLGFQIDRLIARRAAQGDPEPELEQLRRMAGQGRRATRAAVWNLRAGTGKPGSIVRGLEELTGLHDGARVCLHVEGTPYALPIAAETEVLFVAQQAVSNAVEHGRAREIGLDVDFGPKTFELWIRDNGAGFDPAAASGNAPGHFGLIGMRERAERAGGKLVIESVPDVGTEIGIIIERRKLRRERHP
jgi:signal transduction histidine kinase/ligand-binding sensor domain-containing protein